MPKKRHSNLYSKPPSTVHRPLSSTPGPASTGNDVSPTVAELLTSLRRSHATSERPSVPPRVAPSMPSEIRHLLDLPETPSPRPRGRRLLDSNGRRLPAGPAAPSSWVTLPRYKSNMRPGEKDIRARRERCAIDHLPGISRWPAKHSLMAICLRHMTGNWSLQSSYNLYYLATLPTKVRIILLSYLARYGPAEGVGYDGLKSILRPSDEAQEMFSGNEDFERLDLSGSVGRSLSFKQLQELLEPTRAEEECDDCWDTAPQSIPISLSAPFHSLRFLSVANPPPKISWSRLLSFASSIPTVTHLSLANWPAPSLTPNYITATISSRFSPNFQYGGTNFYSHSLDSDYSEAASILRRLSSCLYSLEYLSLDGCSDWSPALHYSAPDCAGIDWVASWGQVRHVSLCSEIQMTAETASRQEIIRYKCAILGALELEKHVRQIRGWISVIHDDWEKWDGLWVGNDVSRYNGMERAYEIAKLGIVRDEEGPLAADPVPGLQGPLVAAPVAGEAGEAREAGGFWD